MNEQPKSAVRRPDPTGPSAPSAGVPFIENVATEHPDCLRDESRRQGRADSVSFPADERELRAHMAAAAARGTLVTLQGARTGITGGAVPEGGHVLSLSRMTRALGLRRAADADAFLLTVQPGLTLAALREALARAAFDASAWTPASRAALADLARSGRYCFPPDPTETSASVGGMAACNASGAGSFRYGPTRDYVSRARVVLADGDVLALARGRERADGRAFTLRTEGGRVLAGRLPSYAMPRVKNAAGYAARDGMDLLDLFVGAEGTLGAFAELELRLVPAPSAIWGVMAFLPSESDAIAFVERSRAAPDRPAAIEFFNRGALELVRRQKARNSAFESLPDAPAGADTAVYVEYHGGDEAAVESAVTAMSEIMTACRGDPEATWVAADARELQRLKDFRHAVPEIVNLTIDERRRAEPRLTKLGTDLAVPDAALRDALAMYHAGLDRLGLEYVMFGHVGDNHIHVNIMPHDLAEYDRARELYAGWARTVVAMGGTVSAEHGIGKSKTALLEVMYGPEGIGQMKALKRVFDPEGRLNRGNLFEW
ncbi:MAG: FAD-binding oxidoreductase [Lentisphaerae bacterium]|nr:FAD-binding oxidoreductase [Lentisphaerota bacterium]